LKNKTTTEVDASTLNKTQIRHNVYGNHDIQSNYHEPKTKTRDQ